MTRSSVTRRSRGSVAVTTACLLVLQLVVPPPPARGEDFWNTAKDYSAGLAQAASAAASAAVAAAAVVLQQRKQELESARAVLNGAKTLAACAEAAAIVAECETLVAAAQVAYAAAVKAASVAAAIAAGIAVGTVIGEAADWVISRCWDPPCVMHGGSPAYAPPSDAAIDLWMPDLLQVAGGAALAPTRAAFDSSDVVVPGSGTASWNFIHAGVRLFSVAVEGAGAYTARLCGDVSLAATDLQAALQAYTQAIDAFHPHVAAATIYSGDPRPDLAAARASAEALVAYVGSTPGCFTDPDAVLTAALQARTALDDALATLEAQSLPSGAPRALQGTGGYFPDLTLTAFQQFLADCATFGASALPPYEAATTDTLLARMGLQYQGVTGAGWDLAAYVGEGDLGNEASLFTNGPLPFSEIYRTSIAHHWVLVDPFASPTYLECATSAVPVPEPASPALVVRVSTPHAGGLPTLWVSVREPAHASIDVFGVAGAVVERVFEGELQAGTRRFALGDARGRSAPLASGVYYVRVRAGLEQQVQRFVLVR